MPAKWAERTRDAKGNHVSYAYSPDLPGIKIAICQVNGVTKYVVYQGKNLVSVHTDREEAKRIAEGL